MKLIYKTYMLALSMVLSLGACSRGFLEIKPQRTQVIVETLQDVESLLDNASVLNRTDYYRLISDGDFYYTDSKIMSIPEVQRNLYLWNAIIDPTERTNSAWDMPYQQIMYANVAMETLTKMSDHGGNRLQWDVLLGRALFFRAWAHYNLLQDFAEGYDESTDSQLGVPIIKNSNYPRQITRSFLKEVYDFTVDDLNRAKDLLPLRSDRTTRPSQQAVHALLSRIYLNQGAYGLALEHAEKALHIQDTLLDYNELPFTAVLPFSVFNYNTHPEIIFFTSSTSSFVAVQGIQVNDDLTNSYGDGDLRKKAFLNSDNLYIGTYSGASSYNFTGLANDELYLTKAESLVRMDRLEEAKEVMSTLLMKRFINNDITVDIPRDKDELLRWILRERQKELVGRGIRWSDLKRLNRDGNTQSDLVRNYQGERYELPTNSSRYVFALPLSEIEISGLEQNMRD
ncbi:RagB/SusD family nutrient uptake outer membrane protein [Sphingobacterium gobiense]|uniref:RagB/SusD family nutrient uptake outer membrane protein n=1 Tax=Sphingobacterium gobiense TaxID=1382456 RepID=A0A2S9JNJ8_9SPHI|nr:RagB/SusD family nutrient uptake outer membrane protein [Sphingobacterium gobiense]PRD54701.1 hypothetical protein C5749_14810 [Sphingobacterium gobiense]